MTNGGILIMQDIPKKYKCVKCAPWMLCPRGPSMSSCPGQKDTNDKLDIKYSEIKSIINFPQMPQKLVIIYSARD